MKCDGWFGIQPIYVCFGCRTDANVTPPPGVPDAVPSSAPQPALLGAVGVRSTATGSTLLSTNPPFPSLPYAAVGINIDLFLCLFIYFIQNGLCLDTD